MGQAKSVFIAGVAGLGLALVSQISQLTSKGYVTPLDTFNPFNLQIIAYWVGLLGAAPFLFVLVTIAVTARKAGLLRSIFTGLGAIFGISLLIAVAVIAIAAARPPKEFPFADMGPERTEFLEKSTASCVTKQRSLPQNASVPVAAIAVFCNCYATALADRTAIEDVVFMDQHSGAPSPSAIQKMTGAYKGCLQASP